MLGDRFFGYWQYEVSQTVKSIGIEGVFGDEEAVGSDRAIPAGIADLSLVQTGHNKH